MGSTGSTSANAAFADLGLVVSDGLGQEMRGLAARRRSNRRRSRTCPELGIPGQASTASMRGAPGRRSAHGGHSNRPSPSSFMKMAAVSALARLAITEPTIDETSPPDTDLDDHLDLCGLAALRFTHWTCSAVSRGTLPRREERASCARWFGASEFPPRQELPRASLSASASARPAP